MIYNKKNANLGELAFTIKFFIKSLFWLTQQNYEERPCRETRQCRAHNPLTHVTAQLC